MKNFILFLFSSMILLSCSSTNKVTTLSTSSDISYLIKNINRKKSWYLIYAERKDTLYKIVSKVDNNTIQNCNNIIVGRRYKLDLKSRRENIPVIGGVRLKPVNYLDVQSSAYDKNGKECYSYDEKTEICTEPKQGIYDLFYTDDLKGICYLK